jgi:hypothetical protein
MPKILVQISLFIFLGSSIVCSSQSTGKLPKGDWKLIEYFETGDIELFNELVVWRNQTNAPVPTIHNPEYRND